jgi:beta-phosphoglucomutase-like phosphatase (HAD superfamily)
MTAQHTPGPWRLGNSRGRHVNYIYAHGEIPELDKTICHVTGIPMNCKLTDFDNIAYEERLSTARLIAAAPDLLAALQALTTWATSLSEQSDENAQDLLERFRRNHCGAMFAAESAISKALGDQ